MVQLTRRALDLAATLSGISAFVAFAVGLLFLSTAIAPFLALAFVLGRLSKR